MNFISEKEEEIVKDNDEVFINSNVEDVEDFIHKFISNQKDIEPDMRKDVDEVFWDLIPEKEEEIYVKPVVKPNEEIDDFWTS